MEDRIGQSVRSALDGEPRVDAAPPREWPVLLDRVFGPDDIAVLRHEAIRLLAAAGLAGDRQDGFVLAVNEVLTNVVLHAGGSGRVVLKIEDGSVWCVVTDSGPGIPGAYLDGLHAAEAFEVGGRGLWLAHRLCDEVTTATGPIGTSIGLRIILDSAG
ncbi:ATP-binding protein [Actinoplanes philippinensis]|uniref:ATP-binding protein n=1 Tax=Actinoplanes philippinensis TaxID=35752 RepID=UPI0034082EC4